MSVRVRDLTGDWRVVWEGEAAQGRRFRDFDEALRFVSRWCHDPMTVTALRSLLAQRDSAWGALRDDALVGRCAHLLALGRLRCVRVVPIRVGDIVRRASDAQDTLPRDALLTASARKTWIEIELTDMEGNPMPGERYWIKLPDGRLREGTLDRHGRAYFDGLDPGDAEIRWPDRDGDATLEVRPQGQHALPAVAPTPEQPLGERTWIEIELLDMEGAPVPNEAYWIKLPDGSLRTGRLDAHGRAYFDDLDPGRCIIRWPDRDDEATLLDLDPTTATPHTDVPAQVETLRAAAHDGAPFCEECARAAAAQG